MNFDMHPGLLPTAVGWLGCVAKGFETRLRGPSAFATSATDVRFGGLHAVSCLSLCPLACPGSRRMSAFCRFCNPVGRKNADTQARRRQPSKRGAGGQMHARSERPSVASGVAERAAMPMAGGVSSVASTVDGGGIFLVLPYLTLPYLTLPYVMLYRII